MELVRSIFTALREISVTDLKEIKCLSTAIMLALNP